MAPLSGTQRFVAVPQAELARVLGQSTINGARVLANRIRQRAVVTCPRGDRSDGQRGGPRLADTITQSVFLDPRTGWRILVGSTSVIAYYVHEGTPPHLIKPQKATVLRFTSRSSGQVVFARQVYHPGTRANPWLRLAVETIVRSA